MLKELYWVDGSWLGRLAVGPRPRGGDWLKDDIAKWRLADIDAVISLLTPLEERELNLRNESDEIKSQGMEFLSFPIPDREVPASEAKFAEILERIAGILSTGKNALVHCRQGIGRSGLVAACLLVKNGMSPGAAIDSISAARGVPIPETPEQRNWIDHYAAAWAESR